jgi:hypothetical protein
MSLSMQMSPIHCSFVIGDCKKFKSGRLAALIEVILKQHSSGDKALRIGTIKNSGVKVNS